MVDDCELKKKKKYFPNHTAVSKVITILGTLVWVLGTHHGVWNLADESFSIPLDSESYDVAVL